jgi:hypothetical protein
VVATQRGGNDHYGGVRINTEVWAVSLLPPHACRIATLFTVLKTSAQFRRKLDARNPFSSSSRPLGDFLRGSESAEHKTGESVGSQLELSRSRLTSELNAAVHTLLDPSGREENSPNSQYSVIPMATSFEIDLNALLLRTTRFENPNPFVLHCILRDKTK